MIVDVVIPTVVNHAIARHCGVIDFDLNSKTMGTNEECLERKTTTDSLLSLLNFDKYCNSGTSTLQGSSKT